MGKTERDDNIAPGVSVIMHYHSLLKIRLFLCFSGITGGWFHQEKKAGFQTACRTHTWLHYTPPLRASFLGKAVAGERATGGRANSTRVARGHGATAHIGRGRDVKLMKLKRGGGGMRLQHNTETQVPLSPGGAQGDPSGDPSGDPTGVRGGGAATTSEDGFKDGISADFDLTRGES